MDKGYQELILQGKSSIPPDEVIALLYNLGFEGFWEKDEKVMAYMPLATFTNEIRKEVDMFCQQQGLVSEWGELPEQNWNKTWESNFNPVVIKQLCMVRAPFHQPDPRMKYDIVIEPRMSFGTGHHETTSMMIEMVMEIPIHGKNVLDMGTGTGILAILARMMGAKRVMAVDNNIWAYENCLSNITMNNIKGIDVILGDASFIKNKCFDIIFANINRNILLSDMVFYADALKAGGDLLISGFYSEDLKIIDENAGELGLIHEKKIQLNNWIAARYKKRTE